MTVRFKALFIVIAVLGIAAIGINVYLGLFKPPKKTITAIDMATGEVKQLTQEEAKAIRDEIIGKIEESRKTEQEERLKAEREGEKGE